MRQVGAEKVSWPRVGEVRIAERSEPGRRSRAARSWTVAAALALLAPAIAFVLVRVLTPSDGTHLRPGANAITSEGLVISPLVSSPLVEGDVITHIGGVPVVELASRALGGSDRASSAGASVAPMVPALRGSWAIGNRIPYRVTRDGASLAADVVLRRHPLLESAARTWGTIVFALVTFLVGSFVFVRRSDVTAARVLFVSAAALVGATTWSLGLQPSDLVLPAGFWLYQITTVAVFMVYWTSIFHFALVFPSPMRLARTRWFVPLAYVVPFAGLAVYLGITLPSIDDPLARIAAVAPVTAPHAAVFLGLALVTVQLQYRRHSTGKARQQIRWVVLAACITGGAGLALYILPPIFGLPAVSPNAIGPIVTLFPIAVAVAVLRHNLFDIDTLLNRALVYGTLTFTVAAAYIVVVTALGAIFQTRAGDLLTALVATGVAAVAFQPLRDRLQRAINRMMYGERDEPAAVLGRLGERLESTLAQDRMLPTLVETIATALKLPHVSIALGREEDRQTVAEFGRPVHAPIEVPLVYRGAEIGRLRLEPRAPDEPFTPSETALISTIARQASVAAFAVQATADLRRSRERLVAAREEERRRLRRDLHDGLGPALAGLTLKLDAASNVIERDPSAAQALLDQLRSQVQAAVVDLRRLVHALRPPALDDLGLVGALQEQVHRYEHDSFEVSLEAPSALGPVPAAVELAVYRIAQEALTNAVRHARARRCRVQLSAVGNALVLVVADDGIGIGHLVQRGLGLESMRERAEELGGSLDIDTGPERGTSVVARLPLREVS